MSLIACSECGRQISTRAVSCPGCGAPNAPFISAGTVVWTSGYDYRTRATLFGLPLVNIASGRDERGRQRIARGIIAIGDVAVGLISLGGCALGGFTMGGASIGLISIGGMAVGLLGAVGGCAVGAVALGGMGIGYYAAGGGAIGVHTMSAAGGDPEAAAFFHRFLGVPLRP